MSADLLREAAAKMRERAEAATSGPWFGVTGPGGYPNEVRTGDGSDAGLPVLFERRRIGTSHYMRGADAHHIASWHPAVALAVADWLERDAQMIERVPESIDPATPERVYARAFAVARAYLGESS